MQFKQYQPINQVIMCVFGDRLWNPCPLDYSDIPTNSGLLISVMGLMDFSLCSKMQFGFL